MGRRAGLTIVEGLVVFVVLCVAWGAFVPSLRLGRGKANRTKCQGNLRQLALGAIQYADDKRVFPHVLRRTELDGGMETSDTPRKVRLLVAAGYVDNAEALVCPSSDDLWFQGDAVASVSTAWDWNGGHDPPGVDPTLLETTELSYGWTRRWFTSNTRSSILLGADRASRKDDDLPRPPGLVGNHAGGSFVFGVDGTVSWLAADEPLAAQLAAVGTVTLPGGAPAAGPALTVEPPVDVPGHLERGQPRYGLEAVALAMGPPVFLLLLLLVGLLLGRREAGEPGRR